ncbi:MAG: hypothetical protein QXV27_04290 [Candidatus Caldarchaeum sp.]
MKAFRIVDEIRRERRLGSTALAWKVLEAYRALAVESSDLSLDAAKLAEEVENARPSMPLVRRFSLEVLSRVRRFEPGELLKACEEVEKTYRGIAERLVETAAAELGQHKTVCTMSHSGTVLQILKKAAGVEKVFVLESRPLREGLITAAGLKALKKVVVCVDAAAFLVAGLSDAVVVGADALFPDGSFSSKLGAGLLALAARNQNKPVYVACDTWKKTDKFEQEHGPPEDLDAGPGLEAFNPVFEKVAASLVSSYLTERGVFKTI